MKVAEIFLKIILNTYEHPATPIREATNGNECVKQETNDPICPFQPSSESRRMKSRLVSRVLLNHRQY